MNRRITSVVRAVLVVVALSSSVLLSPPSAHAAGATQLAGLGVYADALACGDPAGQGAAYALSLTGDLDGCLYTFVETADCSPSGTYRETGNELFVGQYIGADGAFRTTYRFTAKYADCANLVGEFVGRCQHPIISGSGMGMFTGVSGRLDFRDDVAAGTFPYRGHLQWATRSVSQRTLRMDSAC